MNVLEADSARQILSSETQLVEGEDVGIRIRKFRLMRRQTLRAVAERAHISESFLSQIERGVSSASIATIRNIALALGLKVSDLFGDDPLFAPRVVRAHERPSLAFGVLGTKYKLTPSPHRHVEVFLGEFQPGGSTGTEPYTHGDSEELLFVLQGHMRLTLGDAAYDLGPGDCIDYHSSRPHLVTEVAGERALALWVISPPSY